MPPLVVLISTRSTALVRSMQKYTSLRYSSSSFSTTNPNNNNQRQRFLLPPPSSSTLPQVIANNNNNNNNKHNLSLVQRRTYANSNKQYMLAKNQNVYDAVDPADHKKNKVSSISELEQEQIKVNLSSNTGTEETHFQLVQNLEIQFDKLSSMQDRYEHRYHKNKNVNDNIHNDDEYYQETKNLIHQMQIVAQEYTNLGMLEDAKSLQEDILQRLMDYHKLKSNNNKSDSKTSDDTDIDTDNDTDTTSNDDTTNNNLPQHLDIARIMHNIGSIQSRMNEPHDAKKWFDVSLQMKRSILCERLGYGFHYEIGKTLNGLALVHFQMEDSSSLNDIVNMFQTAEQNYLFHGEKINDRDISNNTNDSNRESGLTMEEEYDSNSMSNHPHLTSINSNIAMIYRNDGDYSFAVQRYKEALRVEKFWMPNGRDSGDDNDDDDNNNNNDAVTNNNTMNVVGLLMDIGDCYQAMKDYEDALSNYEEALQLHMVVIRKERLKQYRKIQQEDQQSEERNGEESNDIFAVVNPMDDNIIVSPVEGILRHNIGLMYANLGEFDDAMAEYQSSLKIKKKIDENNPEVAKTYNAIGALEATKGEYDSAKAFFNQALNIYRMNSTTISGSTDEDSDEAIFQTKRNIELIERQRGRGGFGGPSSRSSRNRW